MIYTHPFLTYKNHITKRIAYIVDTENEETIDNSEKIKRILAYAEKNPEIMDFALKVTQRLRQDSDNSIY